MTTELKRLQIRFPRAAAEAAAEAAGGGTGGANGEDSDDLPPWVTSSEVMSPLLAAYDARIQARLRNRQPCNVICVIAYFGRTQIGKARSS